MNVWALFGLRSRFLSRRPLWASFLLICIPLLIHCGGKAELPGEVPSSPKERFETRVETCNFTDDDLDGVADENYRDDAGHYLDNEHCGTCNVKCVPNAGELGVSCLFIDEQALCQADNCAPNFVMSRAGRCVPLFESLCRTCLVDEDCGPSNAHRCVDIADQKRCATPCELGCPSGYRCDDRAAFCIPAGGSCDCQPGDNYRLACNLMTPDGESCAAEAICQDGTLSECLGHEETCDESDNDCDGKIDEGYRDVRGAYGLDIRHCGQCGVDCTQDGAQDLVCGGDPLSPSCVLHCPDVDDGLHAGDRIDADGDIASGCECRFTSLEDIAGPIDTEGDVLDTNCDGADGVVTESIYVAPDGNDAWIGSPTKPLRSISAALKLADASKESETPRLFIYVASGAYVEYLTLVDGVSIFGGYRRDFRALEPNGFEVEVRAPANTTTPGGAALVADDVGQAHTEVRWMTFVGRDAREASMPAFGAWVIRAKPNLHLRELQIRAGRAGDGKTGADGQAGTSANAEAEVGGKPRVSIENRRNQCVPNGSNQVAGGGPSTHFCVRDGRRTDVSGGRGGQAGCPAVGAAQGDGEQGRGDFGGSGGRGGQDSSGPITGNACDREVCCGLADFSVPSLFSGPAPGKAGSAGRDGRPGSGCIDPFGQLSVDEDGNVLWQANVGTEGTDGFAGSGGGGGGAGGGTEYEFFPGECAFEDGLGGGGGGGGAGGCGGEPGFGGSGGGISAGLVITRSPSFTIEAVVFVSSDGGDGGDGGAGGDGGNGTLGAQGGSLLRSERSIPPLAGAYDGGRGGTGGRGGSGGGGGGGCGGPSVGIWLTEGAILNTATLRARNQFILANGGSGGRGGGGNAAAASGANGGEFDVVSN